MRSLKLRYVAPAVLLALILGGCGASEEKLAEADLAISLMNEAKTAAEDIYLDVSDTSKRGELDSLAKKAEEAELIEFNKLNDQQIDDTLPSINEITESYQKVEKELSQVLTNESKIKEEKAKHTGLDIYFINKTGMNLSKIVLHDISADTYSDSFIGDEVALQAGYTLMGAALDIYSDSSEWEFVITDDAGTEYTLSCESLKGYELEGASIVLNYDSKAGTGEAVLGSYIPEVEEEPAEGEEAAEGASGETTEAAAESSSN
jgi:hypothetical protein